MSIDVHKNIFSELSEKEYIYKYDIQQMWLEDCKIMLKAKQNEEKIVFKVDVSDIPEDVKKKKIKEFKKEMEIINE